jgi:AmpD protein
MRLGADGRVTGIRQVESPNSDERPAGEAVTLLVVHSISLPPGCFSGDAVERLFTNRLDVAAHPYYEQLAGMRVSAHFFIRRDGETIQFVPVGRRAWHAGESAWNGRARCNDFSIGVELEGVDDGAYTDAQYRQLSELVRALRASLPLDDLAAHSEIAPGRKTDPGPNFDWPRLRAALRNA